MLGVDLTGVLWRKVKHLLSVKHPRCLQKKILPATLLLAIVFLCLSLRQIGDGVNIKTLIV